MAKPFDATTKDLLERNPRAWLEFLLERKLGPVRAVDADLSTITAESDKVFRVGGRNPFIVHVELIASHAANLALRMERYNILVRYRHQLHVQSIAFFLRPRADRPSLTGTHEDHLPGGVLYHQFRYNVVRIWERPAGEILAGDLATLPLAPLADVSLEDLPAVIKQMEDRVNDLANPRAAADVWAATYILMGLVYPAHVTKSLLAGVRNMKESATYQEILREGKAAGRAEGRAEGKAEGKLEGIRKGRIEEAKRLLVRQGQKRFGPPTSSVKAKVESVVNLAKLEKLADKILDVQSWDELIAGI